MPASRFPPAAAFLLLALLMAATRVNHFGLLPDASWAVFFIAGFYLRAQLRWAFPALMAVAVAVDYAVVSGTGQSFWLHYCVSPGYWFLLPAHFSMWIGGVLLARQAQRDGRLALASLVPLLLAAVLVCHLFAQGGFYWLSDVVAAPSLAGWWKNYLDWLPAYLRTSAMYVGIAAVVHVSARAMLIRAASAPASAR